MRVLHGLVLWLQVGAVVEHCQMTMSPSHCTDNCKAFELREWGTIWIHSMSSLVQGYRYHAKRPRPS